MIQQMDHSLIDKNTKQSLGDCATDKSFKKVRQQHDSFITVFIMKKRIKKGEQQTGQTNTPYTVSQSGGRKRISITKYSPIKEE